MLATRVVRSSKNVPIKSQLVTFDPPTFNFGTLLQNQTVSHEFRLMNRSTNEVRVVALSATCSCTLPAAGLAGSIIKAGADLKVPVEFKTGGRDGPVSSSVTVLFESADSGHTRFAVQAELLSTVNADFTFEPVSVDFGGINPGESATKIVTFSPKALKKIAIKQPQGLPKEIEISLKQNELEDTDTSLVITLHAPQSTRYQRLDGIINVPTSSPRVPLVSIQTRGFVKLEVELVPDVIVLPNRSPFGESCFTLRTTQLSRVTRIIRETQNGNEPIREIGDTDIRGEWDLKHVKYLPNSMLVDARQIIFELEVRKGTDQKEAKSVVAQIKSLN